MAKKKLQKLFAVLLALSMLMSMVSVTAIADEGDGEAEEKTASIEVGETVELQGAETAEGTEDSWTSNDEAVAAVDENGVVTGVAEGTATITHTYQVEVAVEEEPEAPVVPPVEGEGETNGDADVPPAEDGDETVGDADVPPAEDGDETNDDVTVPPAEGGDETGDDANVPPAENGDEANDEGDADGNETDDVTGTASEGKLEAVSEQYDPQPDGEDDGDGEGDEPETKPVYETKTETWTVTVTKAGWVVDEENQEVHIRTASGLRAWAASITEKKTSYDGYTIYIEDDIDLSGKNWTSIIKLSGTVTIDGQGHTISNMTINEEQNSGSKFPYNASKNSTYLGFIGDIAYGTVLTVKDITFENAHVQDPGGDNYTWCGVVVGHGAMDKVGDNYGTTCKFINVDVNNSVVTGGHNNGAIMGYGSFDANDLLLFEDCDITNTFIGGYNSTSGILFGMGHAYITVKNCSASGVRLYTDGLNWECDQSAAEDNLWIGYTYETYPSGATYEGNNTTNDTCVVYPVFFHINNKIVKKYVPVNTPLNAFDKVWFGDIFEVSSGKTMHWYDGTDADAKEVKQIVANTTEEDMYPYGENDASPYHDPYFDVNKVNDESYDTQNTREVKNPLTHNAIDLYLRDVPDITAPKPADWEKSKSKTATELNKDYESQVTLSLPAYEEELVSDVVFVLDKSTSATVEEQALEMLSNLNTQLGNTKAKIKVGVVIFNKEANRVLELTELNDASMSNIETAIKTQISSGTNTHAGLLAGIDMLEKDTGVSDSRKYLIFVSDGITYIFDDGNGNPTSIKTTAYEANAGNVVTKASDTMDTLYMKYGYGENFITTAGGVEKYLGSISALMAEDETAYWGSYGGEYTYTLKSNRNGTTKILDDETFKGYVGGDSVDEHANNIDTALYLTYQAYREAASKYHCYTMLATDKDHSATYPWATTFMKYLADGKTVTFDQIQKDIYYLLDAGSKVVDVIGYGKDDKGNDYNFDFVNDIDTLTLTVGGKKLDVVDLTEPDLAYTHPNATACYGFDENEKAPGGYSFLLYYYENGQDGESDECFVWNINVPVSNFAPVQLTYTVKLTNPQKDKGTYGQYDEDGSEGYDSLYTNESATLYPVDSNGYKGDPEEFAKPTVEYTVKGNTPGPGPGKDDDDDDDTPTTPSNPGKPGTPGTPTTDIPDEPIPLDPADPPAEDIPNPDVPKTGDISGLWLAMTVLSGTGLAGVTLLNRKKRDEEV